jgi:hypothetical protein
VRQGPRRYADLLTEGIHASRPAISFPSSRHLFRIDNMVTF